jgi:hypothetical protein
VRYAGDLMRKSRRQAQDALPWPRLFLTDLGLEPKAAMTRIMHLHMDGEALCIEDLVVPLPGSLTRVSCRD